MGIQKTDGTVERVMQRSRQCSTVTVREMKTSNSHIILFTVLQIVVAVLFLLFVRYDPKYAVRSKNSVSDGDQQKDTYPLFQDVHVMIFVGIGFLMTFLKKYGLSAVSLNLIFAPLATEIFTLVNGFFHLHCENPKEDEHGQLEPE